MSAARRLHECVAQLVAEAQARKGRITEAERDMFRRRAVAIRERGAAMRERIDAEVEALECERDELDDAHNDLEELELELLEAEESEAAE